MYKTKGFITGATLLALILIPCSIGLACGTKPVTSPLPLDIPADYTTYTDESNLFSISYPSDWETAQMIMTAYGPSAKQAAANLKAGIPVDKFSFMFAGGRRTSTGYEPNIFVMVEPVPAGTSTLDGIVEADMEKEKEGWPDYLELSRMKTTVDGREAIILEWQATDEKAGKLQYLQLYTMANKTVWIAACATTSGDFGIWKNDVDTIARSLRVYPPTE
jgi:hypothetical protein